MVHVEDLLYAGTEKFQKMFTAGSKDTRDFVYVGWHQHLRQCKKGTTLSQDKYIEKVGRPKMDKHWSRYGEEILDDKDQTTFRRMIGSSNWLTRNSRTRNIYNILWWPGKHQLANTFKKQGANCDRLRHVLSSGMVDMLFSSQFYSSIHRIK